MFNPKVLITLSILVLSAAGFLFYKNTKAYENEIMVRKEEQQKLKISQNRLQTAIDNYNATVDEDNTIKEEIVGLEADEETQKDLNAGLQKQLREKSEQVQFYKDNPDLIREWEDKVRIASESMPVIVVLDKEIHELDKMIEDREGNLERLTAIDNDLVNKHTSLREHIESRSDGRSIPELKTAIRAVYNNWGFVTLQDGDKNGVVINSTLDVVRGEDTVAKLLVTIVERDSASANIIPDSMEPGTILMVGDKVVPASSGVTVAN